MTPVDDIPFGPFRFSWRRRELSRGGRLLPLSRRARDLLCVLVSARGELVTKDELMAQVWPGLAFEKNNLYVQISGLRKILDDGINGQTFLVTVPGRGYRFIGAQVCPPAAAGGIGTSGECLTAEKRPIAVLPLQNMSGEPAEEHFADGIGEEMSTALSRRKHLFVGARNSSFN